MIQVSSSYAFHGKASEDLKDRRKRVKQGSRAAHILTEEKKKKEEKGWSIDCSTVAVFFPLLSPKRGKTEEQINAGKHHR